MSELPFEIPTNKEELRNLFLQTRALLISLWEGFSNELMLQRPGPHPQWSVKDIIAHISWWEDFAIVRIPMLAAGIQVARIEDFDAVNAQVDAIVSTLPLQAVLDHFAANEARILTLIDQFSFEEWTDEDRPNYQGLSFMFLLRANSFGHYYDHIPDLTAFREKHSG